MKRLVLFGSLLLALAVTTDAQAQWGTAISILSPEAHARMVMVDNELEPNDLGVDTNFHTNPLTLHGRVLDYSTFSTATMGRLRVVEGKPGTMGAEPVAFTVRIRREGKMVLLGDELSKATTELEISKVLAKSLPGDYLIITPVSREHWRAKRVLRIVGPTSALGSLGSMGPGC